MSRRRAPLDPDDVLGGRAKPTAVDLLDLIHRVNPTGRELAQSALQSLLVRRFAAEIEVVPDHEGTVLLRHRGHDRDACHAVLSALDDDARAWVTMQLDLGPPSNEELVRRD